MPTPTGWCVVFVECGNGCFDRFDRCCARREIQIPASNVVITRPQKKKRLSRVMMSPKREEVGPSMLRGFALSVLLAPTTAAPLPAAAKGAIKLQACDFGYDGCEMQADTASLKAFGINTIGGPGMMGGIPLNQCPSGMPENITILSTIGDGAIATDRAGANAALDIWLKHAKGKSCITGSTDLQTDTVVTENMPSDGGVVAPAYDFNFLRLAKVASNTIDAWMKCRFGIDPLEQYRRAEGPPDVKPDTVRVTLTREPASRASSGFFQMVAHLILLVRLPPSILAECVAALPDDTYDGPHPVSNIFNATGLPQVCADAWSTSPFTHEVLPPEQFGMLGITKAMINATLDSHLHQAVWDLPCSCRHLAEANYSQDWFCPDTDTHAACNLTDQTMAQLYSHALSDAAKAVTFGCGQQNFGGEHMFPYMPNLYHAGRIDLLMRLENVDDEEPKFEEWITKNTNKPMKPMRENCTFAGAAGNVGEAGTNKGLFNPDQLKDVTAKSVDLQRRVCAMYWSDYVCSAYELPTACQNPDSWMEATFQKIFDNAPITLDA